MATPQEPLPPPSVPPAGLSTAGALRLERTTGLRAATTLLAWAAVLGNAALLVAHVNQRAVWDDPDSTFAELVDVDDLVSGIGSVVFAVEIAALIIASLWTLGAMRNAKLLGAERTSPGLACGSWYIPLLNLVLPFRQLRRAGRALGVEGRGVGLWQIGLVGVVVGTFVAAVGGWSNAVEPDDVVAAITLEIIGAAIYVVAGTVAAVGLTKATRRLDEAAVARAGGG